MTAHVVPRAKPQPSSDEDEKTTAEKDWEEEEEASTTVEPGEAAEKIRAIVASMPSALRTATGITNTGSTVVEEESTGDGAPSVLALTPPSRDARPAAKLVVTQGNELGQEVAIRPGKTYTIGRATDNDFVLTDIAVSRKHFDLRQDNGVWVIVDRGSGNGTVVNGNIEDNPFTLATGDLIEIGNTVFRFEDPAAGPRHVPSLPSMDVVPADDDDDEEEEMSTVAGKPMRSADDSIEPLFPPVATARERPKTLPPPTPLRAAPEAAPRRSNGSPAPYGGAQASPLPLPPLGNRPQILGPAAQTILESAPLPGANNGAMLSPYPLAQEIPPHSAHAMHKIAANGGRNDPSTAHVAPVPYAPPLRLQHAPAPFTPPQLSKRTKIMIGAAGASVLAAIIVVAATSGGGGGEKKVDAAAAKVEAGKAVADKPITDKPVADKPAARPSTVTATPIQTPAVAKTLVADQTPAPTLPPTAKTEPTLPGTAKPEPTIAAKPEPAIAAKPAPAIAAKPAPTPTPKPTPTPQVATSIPSRAAPKPPPPKPTPTPQVAAKPAPKPAPPPPPKPEPKAEPKRVATADSGDATKQAFAAYSQKEFSQALKILSNAAGHSSGDDAAKLRRIADNIDQFSKNYNVAMSPGAPATDAFDRLRRAESLDGNVNGAFSGEIESRLKEVSAKAAIGFMGQHNYEKALAAAQKAEAAGVSDGNVKAVRGGLDREAKKLLDEAASKADSDPKAARTQVAGALKFIDKKSSQYDRAQKLQKQLAQ